MREGCATSPVIFNKLHLAVVRGAEKERAHDAEKRNKKVGIEWSFMPGHSLPLKNVKNTFNSEAKNTTIKMSLFADETTIIGMREEVEEGKQIIKSWWSLKREPMSQRRKKWNSEQKTVRKSES